MTYGKESKQKSKRQLQQPSKAETSFNKNYEEASKTAVADAKREYEEARAVEMEVMNLKAAAAARERKTAAAKRESKNAAVEEKAQAESDEKTK